MKTEYARDNTASSIVVVLSLALAIALIAALIGLSEKPQIDSIGLTAGRDASPAATIAPTFDFGDATSSNNVAPEDSTDTDLGGVADDTAPADAEQPAPQQTIIAIPTSAPEPTPTAEVAAAVEPEPETAAEGGSGAVQPAPTLPTSSGTVQGEFFTAGDENDGAVVAQNLITISFSEDGSGEFQGVLDITYVDDTHVLLNMSGPLTWGPTNPQVEAVLTGAFTLDSPIDADDVMTSDADLSISSLQAGSGSLCTTKCFGLTFPPQ